MPRIPGLTGHGLSDSNEILVIHPGGGGCGSPNSNPVEWRHFQNPQKIMWNMTIMTLLNETEPGCDTNSTLNDTNCTYNESMHLLGTPWTGYADVNYIVCWAPNPRGSAAGLLPPQFGFAVVRAATLNGPRQASFECTLGLPCVQNYTGIGLRKTNEIIVIDRGECGRPSMRLANWTGSDTLDRQGSFGSQYRLSEGQQLR